MLSVTAHCHPGNPGKYLLGETTMTILIVTNRNVNQGSTDDTLFGDGFNRKGPGELRFAWAEHDGNGGNWKLKLIPETGMTPANLPSRKVFEQFRDSLIASGRDCTMFVHGFNQTLKKNLRKCWELEHTYGVDVVAFSWPSNPGGFKPREYRKAQAAARISVMALDRAFEKLGQYVHDDLIADCRVSFNLIIHSLGNYLFESFVRDPVFAGQTRIFDNLILHEADVNHRDHYGWVNALQYSKRVLVTINENDKVLDWSDTINPDRLGNTARDLTASRSVYVDFTDAKDVGQHHRLFWKARRNPHVKGFFDRALHGRRAELGTGLTFNPQKNAYEVA